VVEQTKILHNAANQLGKNASDEPLNEAAVKAYKNRTQGR